MNTETTLSRTWGFQGKLLNVEILTVGLPNGREALREIVRHPGAAVVLARLPDGRFAFVRQYRKAVEQAMLEVVAGTREQGETPESCAEREVLEECGHGVERLTKLGLSHPAPGYTDECLHLYLADVAATAQPLALDEDEALDVVYMSEQDVESAIAEGRITDAKTLCVWLLYKSRAS